MKNYKDIQEKMKKNNLPKKGDFISLVGPSGSGKTGLAWIPLALR